MNLSFTIDILSFMWYVKTATNDTVFDIYRSTDRVFENEDIQPSYSEYFMLI